MKIGVLTFHWAANHGAVLQAFATQEYIKKTFESEVFIIDYYPDKLKNSFKNLFKTKRVWNIPSRIKMLIKENHIDKFRNKLNLTERYFNNQQLIDNPPDYDMLICGSDQIWNQSYLRQGEGKITPVYFLNFGKKNTKKIALSVSLGCEKYSSDLVEIIKPYVLSLNAISVRESTGIDILNDMGVHNAVLTADPTSLLTREQYLDLCNIYPKSNNSYTALCILHEQSRVSRKIIKNILSYCNNKVINIEDRSIEGWLAGIRDSEIVVTNSFHCVMMCLKLHKPFWVVTEMGKLAGMNDRLFSLLKHFNLTDCIISNLQKSISITQQEFNWSQIDKFMDAYSETLKTYLNRVVGG